MTPFLKSIAKAYTDRYKDLSDFLFVFPNKRSGVFFSKYLKEEIEGRYLIAPECITITDFVARLSQRTVITRIEQLFLLYKCYLKILKIEKEEDLEKEKLDFDSFRSWGETVLSDFNTVDQYLVDTNEVFKNVKDFRDLSTNFLTEDQKKVINEYFGHEISETPGRFWKIFKNEGKDEVRAKFIYLWRILKPLYDEFQEQLKNKGLATTGGAYRKALETLEENLDCLSEYKKIIIIGFNALSFSEYSIFKTLREKEGEDGFDDFADFYWDATGPILLKKENTSSKFIRFDKEEFPSPAWSQKYILESEKGNLPELRIIACPSKVSQTKILSQLLLEDIKDDNLNEIEGLENGIVMPDETLLLPMLYSIPENIENINLTMGYPFRLTPIIPFISSLRRLFFNMKTSQGDKIIYHKDIRKFLSQTYAKLLLGHENIQKIISHLNIHHKISISLPEIKEIIKDNELFSMFDFPISKKNPLEALSFIEEILIKLQERINSYNDDEIKINRLEIGFIETYLKAIKDLRNAIEDYEMKFNFFTAFQLLDRLIGPERIMFEGEPLKGLQVMGTLETRLLDFENIYILSMNERVFPKRMRTKSFIPDILRRAYGMPPANYAEEIFSYYFFRMISRAKKVTLLYDSRTGVSKNGGISRYILQLKHLYAGDELKEETWSFTLKGEVSNEKPIRMTNELSSLLLSFQKEGGKNLSSSSLNVYRECQKKFFYNHVIDIEQEIEYSEYMDAITCGIIVHDMMMDLYLDKDERKKFLDKPKRIDRNFLENILADEKKIWNLLTEKINDRHFKRNKKELNEPLKGSSELVGQQLMEMIKKIIRHDLTLVPFYLHGCEITSYLPVKLKGGRTVNFKFAIDRLDEIEKDGIKRLRIVDYKTGAKKRSADSLEEIFEGDYKSEQIFQLFIYAWLLEKLNYPGSEDVRTEIYSVNDFSKGKEGLPEVGKEKVESIAPFKEEFSARLENMIESIFTNKEFKPTSHAGNCALCQFKQICAS